MRRRIAPDPLYSFASYVPYLTIIVPSTFDATGRLAVGADEILLALQYALLGGKFGHRNPNLTPSLLPAGGSTNFWGCLRPEMAKVEAGCTALNVVLRCDAGKGTS